MSRDFELRFPIADIPKYAGLYDYPGEAELIAGPVARARTRGRLTYEEFVAIGKWKSQRPRNRQAANPSAFVEEVTRIALARDTSPRLAIEVLTLSGSTPTSWPATIAVPLEGARIPQSIRIVVLLPQPVGPSSPKMLPRRMRSVSRSTATKRPNRRVSASVETIHEEAVTRRSPSPPGW